jgi:rhodanese-related sulfurtransferase
MKILNIFCIAALVGTTFHAGRLPAADSPTATDTPAAVLQPHPGGLLWLTGLAQAQLRAKAEGKSVLLFFHGSDWCPACVEMQRQVFDSPEFREFARRALILVDVDFPEKHKQAESLRQANLALKAKFNLSSVPDEGFPTIVLLNAAGQTVFQETGYNGGGPAAILPSLRRHVTSSTTIVGAVVIKNLTVDEFAQMAADKQNVILDVRTAKEFAAGHLPGAINLDVMSPDFAAKAAALDKSKVYLVHCASGARSARACDELAKLDFQKLYNLPAGFRGWAKAGKPVEQ